MACSRKLATPCIQEVSTAQRKFGKCEEDFSENAWYSSGINPSAARCRMKNAFCRSEKLFRDVLTSTLPPRVSTRTRESNFTKWNLRRRVRIDNAFIRSTLHLGFFPGKFKIFWIGYVSANRSLGIQLAPCQRLRLAMELNAHSHEKSCHRIGPWRNQACRSNLRFQRTHT